MQLNGLKRSQKRSYLTAASIFFILLFHQNCSQPGAINVTSGSSVNDLGNTPDPGATGTTPIVLKSYSTETFANTELNKPVEFTLEQVKEDQLFGVRILTDQKFLVLNGTLEAVDLAQFKFRYTPNVGYRGSDYSVVNGVDDKGQKISFNVKIAVANPVQNLKPALAIRGMGCVQCHSKVDSNIVTDFGYGDSYFFSGNAWNSGGIYGDHAQAFSTMELKSTIQILVPQATTPLIVQQSTGAATLSSYISGKLAQAGVLSTRAVQVVEKSKVYIGSPTQADIVQAFTLKSSERIKYFKNGDSSPALSGLSDQATYFKNDGVLICEGDVALRGPLFLENLQVNSASGCRLYVIGSVFIYGGISQTNTSENRNLQIASTVSINLGLGLTKKDNSYCEPTSRYATEPSSYNVSSLRNRYVTFWTVSSFVTRAWSNAGMGGNAVMAESALIEKGEGTLWDASCRSEGRNVAFDRLLLNAPAIQSRYIGNVTGTLIAEYALMSLGEFKFQYDPVFDRTPILPLLKHEVYLDIQ